MGIFMPSPTKIGNTYYLRVAVPGELKGMCRGKTVSLPVGESWRQIKVTTHAKVSLGTRDPAEAKRRFTKAHAHLENFWDTMRAGPTKLTQKMIYSVAGEIQKAWVRAFDEEPGSAHLWRRVQAANASAFSGAVDKLSIKPKKTQADNRFGPLVDAFLARHNMVVADEQRTKLLKAVGEALSDAAQVNERKARGDYSDPHGSITYPLFTHPVRAPEPLTATKGTTFDAVINEEKRYRSAGRDGRALKKDTENKWRNAAKDFAAFRKSTQVGTVTPQEVGAWRDAMQAEGKLGNKTIKDRMDTLQTLLVHANHHSDNTLFSQGNPAATVRRPASQRVASDERTLTLEEAASILRAAREQIKPELRWLPWMCAYSGARINELSPLQPSDFFQVQEHWFYRISTKGGRSVKTKDSQRNVPIHRDLISEGLMDFVEAQRAKSDERLFPPRSDMNVRDWVRNDLGIVRKQLAPNHGWRHLFEDLAVSSGMEDAAKNYITGRSENSSGGGYGRSEARLPGLARAMDAIEALWRI